MPDSCSERPNAFAELIGEPLRARKPRTTGRTMVIDWGMGSR